MYIIEISEGSKRTEKSRKLHGGCGLWTLEEPIGRLYLARDQVEKDPMGRFIVAACLGDLSTPMGHLVSVRSTCHASAPSRYFCCLRRSFGENTSKLLLPRESMLFLTPNRSSIKDLPILIYLYSRF